MQQIMLHDMIFLVLIVVKSMRQHKQRRVYIIITIFVTNEFVITRGPNLLELFYRVCNIIAYEILQDIVRIIQRINNEISVETIKRLSNRIEKEIYITCRLELI